MIRPSLPGSAAKAAVEAWDEFKECRLTPVPQGTLSHVVRSRYRCGFGLISGSQAAVVAAASNVLYKAPSRARTGTP
jgi:hypothetical protein